MHKILPVIHHKLESLTLEQADLALTLGADGVFLISHRGDDFILPRLGRRIKDLFPDKFVGLNLLHTDPLSAFHLTYGSGLDALWLDNCGIHSEKVTEPAESLKQLIKNANRKFDIYGSVAFKYQAHDADPGMAAKIAEDHGFVATTSGTGTGSAPEVNKIAIMRQAINGELAIASGMTPENVTLFTPHATSFLVSTGISLDFYRIDPQLLSSFIAAVRS